MAAKPQFEAFTTKANGRLQRIITDIHVFPGFDPASPPSPLPKSVAAKALWDTGATHSVLSIDLAQSLGLSAVGATNVTHGGGTSISPRYLVNFGLPHKVMVAGVLVTQFPAGTNGFDVIVGMDVICLGDFAITNVGGITCVSFRTPSCSIIDYVQDFQRQLYAGVRRNDPCPCGSGKKYKNCHRT